MTSSNDPSTTGSATPSAAAPPASAPPRRSRWRWLRWAALGLGAVAIMLILVVVLLGRDRLVRIALDQVSDDWSLARVDGAGVSVLTLHNLRLALPGMALAGERLHLRWSPAALLQGQLVVELIELDTIAVTTDPTYEAPTEPATEASPISLPIPVTVERLAITDAHYAAAPGAPALATIHSALLRIDAIDDHIAVQDITLALGLEGGQSVQISGQAMTTLAPPIGLDAALAISALLPAGADNSAPTHLQTDLTVAGNLAELSGRLAVTAPLQSNIRFKTLQSADQLHVSIETDPLTVPARGTLPELRLDSIQASATQETSTQQISFALRSAIAAADAQAQIDLSGSANETTVQVSLNAASNTGQLGVAANYAPSTGAFAVTAEAMQLDLAPWLALLTSALRDCNACMQATTIDGEARLTGAAANDLRPWQITEARLDLAGAWLGEPVQVRGVGSATADRVDIADVQFQLADNQLTATGNNHDGLTFVLDFVDMQTFWPGLAGSAKGAGTVSADTLRSELTGNAIRFADSSVGSVSLTADLSQAGLNLKARAQQVHAVGIEAPSVALDLSGTRAAHQLAIVAETAQGTLTSTAVGSLGDPGTGGQTWAGTVDQLKLAELLVDGTSLGTWQLEHPLGLRVADQPDATLTMDGTCFTHSVAGTKLATDRSDSTPSTICVEPFALIDGDGALAATITRLPMSLLQPFLPPNVVLTGRLDARANATLERDQTPRFDVDAVVRDSMLLLGEHDEVAEIALTDFTITAAGADGLELAVSLTGDGLGQMRIDTRIEANNQLSGDITARIDTLRPLGLLNPYVFAPEGSVSVALQLAGTTEQPELTGTAVLDGAVDLGAAGIRVAPLQVMLTGAGTQLQLAASGTTQPLGSDTEARDASEQRPADSTSASAAPSSFRLNGIADITDLLNPSVDATLVGAGLRAMATPNLAVTISPDFTARLRDNHLELTGKMAVDSANVVFTQAPPSGPTISKDVTVHAPPGSVATEAAPPISYAVNVTLSVSEQTRLLASGLATSLKGDLTLRATDDKPLLLLGNLDTVNGNFDAYGVTLDITRGRLDFLGAPDNPQINARAVRNLGDGNQGSGTNQVGVSVSGTLQNLKTRLYSAPKLSDAETLAYLITGKPISAVNSSESSKISNASLALGLTSALPVTSQIQQKLQLDELEIVSPFDQNASALMVGKQLTERLHARYTYSIFDRSGGLALQYKLTEHLRLQTEAGVSSQSFDLLWQWTTP